MKLLITGLNHRTAPVEVRELLAFREDHLPETLAGLKSCGGLLEGMILSTCNRVEVVVTAEDDCNAPVVVESFLAGSRRIEPQSISTYLYHYEDGEAIRHLFRVAASLDSMVVGEPQILGQLKAAFQLAKSQGAVAGFLEEVITRAFSVAKRVRSETEIGKSAVSVSYAAVELAREIFGSLNGRKVMLVGAGKMSELAARHLRRSGVAQILVSNRTEQRAREMAEIFEGTIVDYSVWKQSVQDVDIVITSSGAPGHILQKADVRRAIEARRNKPMFFIDIAVPRNIDPEVNNVDNVFLYDIDDLQQVVASNVESRKAEAAQAEEIIAEEVARTLARLRTREVAPTIVTLQDQLEQLRLSEFERIRGKLGSLTPQQEEAIHALTRGIINKIAHGPISELRRQAAQPNGLEVTNVIRKIFRLGER
jgi:glutamyl-tRNA reductase